MFGVLGYFFSFFNVDKILFFDGCDVIFYILADPEPNFGLPPGFGYAWGLRIQEINNAQKQNWYLYQKKRLTWNSKIKD